MDWYILSHSRSEQFGKKIVLERMLRPSTLRLLNLRILEPNRYFHWKESKGDLIEKICFTKPFLLGLI